MKRRTYGLLASLVAVTVLQAQYDFRIDYQNPIYPEFPPVSNLEEDLPPPVIDPFSSVTIPASGLRNLFAAAASTDPDIGVTGGEPWQPVYDEDSSATAANGTHWGRVTVGDSVTHTFRIGNYGINALSVSSVAVSGLQAEDFAVGGISLPVNLDGGEAVEFTITFTPSALGVRSTTVSIGNDDPNESPFNFVISGGVDPASIAPEIALVGGPLKEVIPAAGNTPNQDNGTLLPNPGTGFAVDEPFLIRNSGDETLTISDVSFSGTHAAEFSVSGFALPATVAPGEESILTVTFTPAGSGSREATLTILSDDADESSYVVPLQGGIGAAIVFQTSSFSNGSELAAAFRNDGSVNVSHAVAGGIADSGHLTQTTSTTDVFESRASYPLEVGETYTSSGYFYYATNSGYAGIGFVPAASQTQIYDFEDGLEGWSNATVSTTNPTSLQPITGSNDAGHPRGNVMIAPDPVSDRDSEHDSPLILRSPAVILNDSGDLTAYLLGGYGTQTAPTSDGTYNGFMGVALRQVETGNYVLSKHRSSRDDDSNWEKVTFSQAELTPYINDGYTYTVDLIDDYHGSWGWIGMDDVSIPGELAQPVNRAGMVVPEGGYGMAAHGGGGSFENHTGGSLLTDARSWTGGDLPLNQWLYFEMELRYNGSSDGLQSGVPVSDTVGAGEWHYYTITLPSDATSLTVKTTGTGDADLYTREGAQPTSSTNDYSSRGGTSAETITYASVTPSATYHIAVYGYSASTYTLTATYTPEPFVSVFRVRQSDADGNLGATIVEQTDSFGNAELAASGHIAAFFGVNGTRAGKIDEVTISKGTPADQIDLTGPTVTEVTSASADGTYLPGDALSFAVTFSEVVDVAGTPRLILETGVDDMVAEYVSGSGSDTLTFTATVGNGHVSSDLSYTEPDGLIRNGGEITDQAGNPAYLDLPEPGTVGSLSANKDLVLAVPAGAVPEIGVAGAAGPISHNGGDDLGLQPLSKVNVRYTVTNNNYGDLVIPVDGISVENATANVTGSSVLTPLPLTIPYGESETLAVDVTVAGDEFSLQLVIDSNDPVYPAYTLNLSGTSVSHEPPDPYDNATVAMDEGNSSVEYYLNRSVLGGGFTSGLPDYFFGDIIGARQTSYDNQPVTMRPKPLEPGEELLYVTPENDIAQTGTPVASTEELNYHYSIHSQRVYATESGSVLVYWRSLSPVDSVNGEPVYLVVEEELSISAASAKQPRTMIWTEEPANGPVIKVPDSISALSVIYNEQVPQYINPDSGEPISDPTASAVIEFMVDAQNRYDSNTLWLEYESNTLHADLAEGRVFVELLGEYVDVNAGRREFLGFEIVDVVAGIPPQETTTWIGDALQPIPSEEGLTPSPVDATNPFLTLEANGRYYATAENTYPGEVLVYWMEAGEQNLLWPKTFNSYLLRWPESFAHYAHNLIDNSGGPPVPLQPLGTATLVYQDDPDGKEASILAGRLSVELPANAADTINRALVKIQKQAEFWYLRVYSELQDQPGVPAGDRDGDGTVDAAIPTLSDRDADGVLDNRMEAIVGSRINPPVAGLRPGGYLVAGDCYHGEAYVNPFTEGNEAADSGAIIPVNARPGENTLKVWWFQETPAPDKDLDPVLTPAYVSEYTVVWPDVSDSSADIPRIVIARGDGTGDLPSTLLDATVYHQPDPAMPGFNPNEEHAFLFGGRGYALRDDLNDADHLSAPFVLLDYISASDGRPQMALYHVTRTLDGNNDGDLDDIDPNGDGNTDDAIDFPFVYFAEAGKQLQAPAPLSLLPEAVDQEGNAYKFEVTEAGTDPAASDNEALAGYDGFTFKDRKNATWVYRGPHDGNVKDPVQNAPRLRYRYAYAAMENFYDPATGEDYPLGELLPFLRPLDGDGNPVGAAKLSDISGLPEDGTASSALTVEFIPVWPSDVPELPRNRTVTYAADGLPAIRGRSSAELYYQQSLALDPNGENRSALLMDPTREKTVALSAVPGAIKTTNYQGRTYFQDAPPQLRERFFWDANRGTAGELVLRGEFVDQNGDDDYLLLNVLNEGESEQLKALHPDSNASDYAAWAAAIDGLSTELQRYVETSRGSGEFVSDGNPVSFGAGEVVEVSHPDEAVDSYALAAAGGTGSGFVTLVFENGRAFSDAGNPVSMEIIRVTDDLYEGQLKVIPSSNPLDERITFRHSSDFGGDPTAFEFQWQYAPPVGGTVPAVDAADWQDILSPEPYEAGRSAYVWGQGAQSAILVLSDSYVRMRYRATDSSHPSHGQGWTDWLTPKLSEGWIKRVLDGINPFEQRVTDFFSNSVNTEVSIIAQAGTRWEGNVSLNLENINDEALIPIYETVFNRGKDLSIDGTPPTNYGPANDALLLVTGYLNDLYIQLGNEAFADAANPTIALDAEAGMDSEVATSLFAFQGQVGSLLEEELTLLRGRDDFLSPGVEAAPAYNRLYWNYTGGIASGQQIYALNYNIREISNEAADGVIDETDAQRLFPQGHGDAYGHFLTALKNYYDLLTDPEFTWMPRVEAVTVLGQTVQVDYQDERKLAAAALSLAQTAERILDLTFRRDYTEDTSTGWDFMRDGRSNADTGRTRYWGVDSWASRGIQGAYFNWLTANAIIPYEDPDENHEGIQKIDRTTVAELEGIVNSARAMQDSLDAANSRLNPLGLASNAIVFDISPSELATGQTHFEQIYDRASTALQNAENAFARARQQSSHLRSQEEALADYEKHLYDEERSYNHALIEIYGTPYAGDIGPGKTYATGYDGPDLYRYMVVDEPSFFLQQSQKEEFSFTLDVQMGGVADLDDIDFFTRQDADDYPGGEELTTIRYGVPVDSIQTVNPDDGSTAVQFSLGKEGLYSFADASMGRRAVAGKLQTAFLDRYQARHHLIELLTDHGNIKYELDRQLDVVREAIGAFRDEQEAIRTHHDDMNQLLDELASLEAEALKLHSAADIAWNLGEAAKEFLPRVIGFSNDATSPARGGVLFAVAAAIQGLKAYATSVEASEIWTSQGLELEPIKLDEKLSKIGFGPERAQMVFDLEMLFGDLQMHQYEIDNAMQQLLKTEQTISRLLSEGQRLQSEREVFRKRAAAIIQGYRTHDLAFRLFRNEALEQYKTLFDLAARYTYLAAKAYDYETGLLGTETGKNFLSNIVEARALGIISDGQPQFAGSAAGDPGLSGFLAQLSGDWSVIDGRLGFNNPDTNGTNFSLRTELFRILETAAGDHAWREALEEHYMPDLLADPEIAAQCMQLSRGDGLPVPGFCIDFPTTIRSGYNFFGRPLAAGDSAFTESAFATKIHSAGIVFVGYQGMDPYYFSGPQEPAVVTATGPDVLSATPYVYLIPTGADFLRAPPLGDASGVRSWKVFDQALPLPFNIGRSDFSSGAFFQTTDSLMENPFIMRKHQAFRAVDTPAFFYSRVPEDFRNARLIGRSVWNSEWKLIIPAYQLFNDEEQAVERFLATVEDIVLHLKTYSYSGN